MAAQKPPLTPDTIDAELYTAHVITPLIGKTMTHTGNGKQYVITGYAWMGATDEWGFLHREVGVDGVQLCRPFSQLVGRRIDGTVRYTAEWL